MRFILSGNQNLSLGQVQLGVNWRVGLLPGAWMLETV